MANIFIIHGAYGSPRENWFPWLKEELGKARHRVFVPVFPTPENQNLDSWLEAFERYKIYLNEQTIMIGHSLGPVFILSILEKLKRPIKACYFVSGFIGLLGNSTFDEINKTFADKNFDWEKIKQNCKNFYIYHSDNDPYVHLNKAKELARKLGVEVKEIKGAGHFNFEVGYDKFELLLSDVLNIRS